MTDSFRGNTATVIFEGLLRGVYPAIEIRPHFNSHFILLVGEMYRASSFLFKHAFTVHLGVIDMLSEPRFSVLWQTEFGTNETDDEVMPVISEAIKGIRTAYLSFGEPTDTLVTKVILGTFGCPPACDQYFIKGFRQSGFRYLV